MRSWSAGLNHANNPQRGYFLPCVVNSFLSSSGLQAHKSMCSSVVATQLFEETKNCGLLSGENCRSLRCDFNNNSGAVITAALKALSFPPPLSLLFLRGGERRRLADRPISRGGGADMYPDSRTKGRGHRGAWIKGFGRRGGAGGERRRRRRRRRTRVRGEGAPLKKKPNGAKE